MSIPPVYRKSRENVIASFDAIDLAAGVGFVNFNGFVSETDAGEDFMLNRESFFSTLIETTATTSSASPAKIIDLDFDLSPFNLPSVIRGVGNFQLAMNVESTGSGGAGDIVNGFVIIRVRKWDGSSETEIANAQSQEISTTLTLGPKTEIITLPVTIPKTHFKKGETLRVTVEGWANAEASKDSQITIGHDPKNRDGTNIIPSTDDPITITTLDAQIPFDIAL